MAMLEICQDTGADSWRWKYSAPNSPFSKWIFLQLKAHPSLETGTYLLQNISEHF